MNRLSEKMGMTKKQVALFLDELAGLAYKEARNGFTIPGVGKLVVVDRKARMGRNPATGQPKGDGFRGVLENDGGELALWSRNGRPLLRYFPELRTLGPLLPAHSALDGEIVIELGGRLDFDAMQMRLHPAESRIRKLSAE